MLRSPHAHARVPHHRRRDGARDAGRAPDPDRGRHPPSSARCPASAIPPGARRSRRRPIRSSRATKSATSATPSRSSSPIRSSRRRTPPRRSRSTGSRCRTWSTRSTALKPGAPLVWPDKPGNLAFEKTLGDEAEDRGGVRHGGQDRVAHASSTSGSSPTISTPARSSPNTTSAKDRLTLTLGSQGPHRIRDILCKIILNIPPEKTARDHSRHRRRFRHQAVSVSRICAGGGRGRSGSKRPVKWVADRTEHFLGDAQGRDNVTTAKLALDDDGRFLALRVDTVCDMGAYLSCFRALYPVCRRRDAAGRLRHPGLLHPHPRGVHQHGAGRRLSRRRTAGGGLCDRAAGRRRGARSRRRAGRAAQEELHQAEADALQDADGEDLRLRRVRRAHGARAGGRPTGRGFRKRARAVEQAKKLRGIGLATYIEACGGDGPETATRAARTGRHASRS